MPFLGKRSLSHLSAGSWHLQKVTQRAITKVDFSVIDCSRGKDAQNAAYDRGDSKAKWGESPHNVTPAQGIDFIPCPFYGWEDKDSFTQIKLAFQESVAELIVENEIPNGFELEYGVDWNFKDYGHIEIKGWNL